MAPRARPAILHSACRWSCCSEDDRVADPRVIEDVIAGLRAQYDVDLDTFWWESSEHVKHIVNHTAEYTQLIHQFMHTKCGLEMTTLEATAVCPSAGESRSATAAATAAFAPLPPQLPVPPRGAASKPRGTSKSTSASRSHRWQARALDFESMRRPKL